MGGLEVEFVSALKALLDVFFPARKYAVLNLALVIIIAIMAMFDKILQVLL